MDAVRRARSLVLDRRFHELFEPRSESELVGNMKEKEQFHTLPVLIFSHRDCIDLRRACC